MMPPMSSNAQPEDREPILHPAQHHRLETILIVLLIVFLAGLSLLLVQFFASS